MDLEGGQDARIRKVCPVCEKLRIKRLTREKKYKCERCGWEGAAPKEMMVLTGVCGRGISYNTTERVRSILKYADQDPTKSKNQIRKDLGETSHMVDLAFA